MLLLFLGGYWLYFTPTAEISMDINPSIELAVNWFDRVISVDGWNEDGKELAGSLDVWNLEYTEAVNRVLEENISMQLRRAAKSLDYYRNLNYDLEKESIDVLNNDKTAIIKERAKYASGYFRHM